VLQDLGRIALGAFALFVGVVALLTCVALAHQATPEASNVSLWVLSITLTFAVPFVLAAWKHGGEPGRIRSTMMWLPAVWNGVGLIVGTLLVPDVVGTALRESPWMVEGEFGPDHGATRWMGALGHTAADVIDPKGEKVEIPAPATTPVALEQSISMPVEGMTVTLHGRDGNTTTLPYLFDTGASFTTITSDVAHELGIDIPADAPTEEFNTANGPRESRVVYLDGLTIGDVYVPSLLVSVCDPCATERTSGLLGVNVIREFIAQLDYQEGHVELIPRLHGDAPDRAYDIKTVVKMRVRGKPEIIFGRVRWVVEVENLATVPIRAFRPRVEFTDGVSLYGDPIAEIAAGEVATSLVTGPVGPASADGERLRFTLYVAEATW
jgi:clan AA aspartic protease (TIGR02281 family)